MKVQSDSGPVAAPDDDASGVADAPPKRERASEAELALLVDEHAAAVYRVAVSIVRDPALAEDVVQDTMIRVWEALPTFRGDAPIRTWILRIAHNSAVSLLRKVKDEAWDPVTLPDSVDSADVSRTVVARSDLTAMGEALKGLDELSRSIVVLREVEGLSYEEIAETLDITLPTVKTRLLRARRTLQASATKGGGR